MDLATQTHLKTLRELLGFRLAELRAEVRAAQRGHYGGATAAADPEDEASVEPRSRMDGDREQRERVEKQEVEAALHRLDAGMYGDCGDCGEPIALQRLLVQPATRRCAWCQSRHDADERIAEG